MRKLRALLIPAAALAAALFAIPGGADQPPLHDHLHGDHVPPGTPHEHETIPCEYPIHHDVGVHGDHDHLALSDMQHYAEQHLSDVTRLDDSYGSAPQWAPEWELRWIDYNTGRGVVRIYHATNKHDDNVRYTSLWDGARLHYHAWEPIH